VLFSPAVGAAMPTADFSRISFWRSLNNIGTGLGPRMPVLCLEIIFARKAHYKPSRYFRRVVLEALRPSAQCLMEMNFGPALIRDKLRISEFVKSKYKAIQKLGNWL